MISNKKMYFLATLFFLILIFTLFQKGAFTSTLDQKVRLSNQKTALELAKKYDIKYVSLTSGYIFGHDDYLWGVVFASFHDTDVEQARKLIIAIYDGLWEKIKDNEDFKEDILRFKKMKNRLNQDDFGPTYIAIRMGFWDEHFDPKFYPSLARVDLVENKIKYYMADPQTHVSHEVLVETVEEARKTMINQK